MTLRDEHTECASTRGIPRSQPTAFDAESTSNREEPIVNDPEFRALVERARQIVTEPEQRESLRAAKRNRRHAQRDYLSAMGSLPHRQVSAIRPYHDALVAEAAAQRAEAGELRATLAALIGVKIGGAQ